MSPLSTLSKTSTSPVVCPYSLKVVGRGSRLLDVDTLNNEILMYRWWWVIETRGGEKRDLKFVFGRLSFLGLKYP